MSEKTKVILRPIAVIVCDLVRKEITGKDILIGVYTGNIGVAKYPVTLRLLFWIQVEIVGQGEAKGAFRLRGPNDIEYASVEFGANVERSGSTAISFRIEAPVTADSTLELQFKSSTEDWQIIRSIVVEKAPVPGQLAQQLSQNQN